MKYAQEIIDLMGAYPGREFRMREIVRSIAGRKADDKERKQIRIGVWRVLNQLNESGQIAIQKRKENGAASKYCWQHK
jgi:hypothetical protein